MGDIHGHHAVLETALDRLGYQNLSGIWRHPQGVKAVFLGDLIDRGPANIAVVETVKAMVEAGEAICLMGNHELNAIHFSTPDPSNEGAYLRARSDKNLRQHIAFLSEYHRDPKKAGLLQEHIAWFKTLPLWIDHDEFRAVHACWSPKHLERFSASERDGGDRSKQFWLRTARAGDRHKDAVEVLLKGAEYKLPPGVSYRDKDGNERTVARLQWWGEQQDWRSTVWAWEEVYQELEQHKFDAQRGRFDDNDERPVFFGHYWVPPRRGQPWIVAPPKAVCLDFCAGSGGPLCVYRWSAADLGLDAANQLLFRNI
nr:metallophosphoesterase [Maricaulis sp.]